MTTDEAAERLGLAPATLRAQIGKGSLRGTKRGRDWWIMPREVERYRRESLGQAKGGRPRGIRAPREVLHLRQDGTRSSSVPPRDHGIE